VILHDTAVQPFWGNAGANAATHTEFARQFPRVRIPNRPAALTRAGGRVSDVFGVKRVLEALGHPVTIVEKVAGGMNGVLVDEHGWRHGAACWRADGVPIGSSGGQSCASRESGSPH
jgi:hypothetical protein